MLVFKKNLKTFLPFISIHPILFPIMLLSMIGLLFAEHSLLAYASALCLFSAFDCYGYKYVLTRFKSPQPENYDILNAAYRTMQTSFQIALFYILYLNFGIYPALCFILSWWFGLCDLLYCVFVNKMDYVWVAKDMWWLWWTPQGLITGGNNIFLTGKLLIFFSCLSIILSYFIITLC